MDIKEVLVGAGFWLDKVIYNFISFLYNIFVNISHSRLLNSSVLDGFKKRVYLVLSVATLFLIIYSLLQIIINPDKGLSGEYSIAKIIFNVVKASILILRVPTVFSFSYRVQSSVMDKGFITKLVTGKNSEIDNAGAQFSIPVFE